MENLSTNQVGQLVSIDFFTVSTVQLRVLFVFVVLAHERREKASSARPATWMIGLSR